MSSEPNNESAVPAFTRWQIVRPWLVLLAVAGLARGGILVVRSQALTDDPDAYRAIAENVANHGVFGISPPVITSNPVVPTAYRPPLYPLILCALVVQGSLSVSGTAALHWALGLATVACVAWLGGRFGLDRRRWFAAVLVALDPILLNQSTLIMTETLATFLSIVALMAAERLRTHGTIGAAAMAGTAVGLAALCRPTFLPLVGALAAIELFRPGLAYTWPQRLTRATTIALAAALVVSPWAIRNKLQSGHWIVTTTHGGYTLRLANNSSFYQYLLEGRAETWGLNGATSQILSGWNVFRVRGDLDLPFSSFDEFVDPISDELLMDNHLTAQAWQTMHDEPATAAYASVYRVGQLWNPLAHRVDTNESAAKTWARWAAAVWYVAVFAAALMTVMRMGKQMWRGPWLTGLALCLIFTGVHSLYWTNLRMRAPLMPFVALLAAAGLGRRGAIGTEATNETSGT